MRRISISELSTLRWSFYQDAIRYASLGFETIGVWRQKIDDFDQSAAIDLLFELNMQVSSLHWAGAFTGCDGKSFTEAIEDAEEAIQLARLLDADCLIVHPGSRNGHTHSHARRLFYSALSRLIPIANDFGVKLAVEPMFSPGADKWTIIRSLDAIQHLLESFSTEPVGLVLDLYHVGLHPQLLDELETLIDHVSLVQLADRGLSSDRKLDGEFRCPLGTGAVPLNRWLQRLQQSGYEGDFEIELHGTGMNNVDYFAMLDNTAEYLRDQSIQSLLSLPGNNKTIRQKRTTGNP